MSERRYAVLIASSQFPKEKKLHPLRCPENDVQGLREILASEEYGAFHDTLMLRNEESYTVLRKINKILKKASKDDLVLIYYSGHGKLDDNGRLHLATVDTEVPELEATSVPTERIRSFISNSSCTKLVMILDCCYAGAVQRDFFKSDLDGQLQLISQRGRGIYILTASTETQVAKEKEADKYSLMTKHIIGGIKGGELEANEKGLVSVDRLYNYVHSKVVQEGHQEPTRFGKDVRGELFIARSGKTPREKRNKQIREILFDLAKAELLPDDILDEARKVIGLEPLELSTEDLKYNELLDQLLQKRLGPVEFAREWDKVHFEPSSVTSEPPPTEPPSAEPERTEPQPLKPKPPEPEPAEPKLNDDKPSESGPHEPPKGKHILIIAPLIGVALTLLVGVLWYVQRPKVPSRPAVQPSTHEVPQSTPKVDLQSDRTITNSVGMKFVLIPAGTFTMGSPSNEPNRNDDERQHEVTISKPFYLQTTEVAQGQWKAVMGNNPSHFTNCGNECPVEMVSWDDAQEFIRKLNQMEGTEKYRLPTEAEWEYACRAETLTPFNTGDCISTDQANYNGNYPLTGCSKGKYREKTVKVGSFEPNAWGLYDMHGNVWEWCQDRWDKNYYSQSPERDPQGPSSGEYRVLRGGSWISNARHIRSAARWFDPGYRLNLIGFRVARAP